MGNLTAVIQFIIALKRAAPTADKDQIQRAVCDRFHLRRRRSLFLGPGYAVRFSAGRGGSLPNTVLSLSALRLVDEQPVVVCIVEPENVRFMLANATLLKKVSHSSHHLRVDNIKGSFNGRDILTTHEGVANEPANFERLFAIHAAFTWGENLGRIVEATTAIVGRDLRFNPTPAQREVILPGSGRAGAAVGSTAFRELDRELCASVSARAHDILAAADVDNVNLRGNRVEQIVTGGGSHHDLGDLLRETAAGRIAIDVKTKLSGRASAPKGYNVDKMLAFHAEQDSVFAFLILGIDVAGGTVRARLVPVLDRAVVAATAVRHHWAGRNSRGVTQLLGRFEQVLDAGFEPAVDVGSATALLNTLIDL